MELSPLSAEAFGITSHLQDVGLAEQAVSASCLGDVTARSSTRAT